METSASQTSHGQRPTANANLAREPIAANSVPDSPNLGFSHLQSLASTPDRIVFLLIAALLLFTAIAKLWMLLNDSFADVRVGISREILWLTVLFEFALAAANLFLSNRSLLALINTSTFTLFGIFATARWLLGYGSCGCSGNIEIPATLFIAIDWAIVAWFVTGGFGFVRQPLQAIASMKIEFSRWWHAQSPVSRQRWVGGGLFAALLGLMQLPIAQPVWTGIMGKPAIVALVAVEGDLQLNQTQSGLVTINNRSNHPAKVIGMDRSCRCFELADDPLGMMIPANSKIELPLVIKPNKTRMIQQRIVLFLEHSESFRVPINLAVFVKGDE